MSVSQAKKDALLAAQAKVDAASVKMQQATVAATAAEVELEAAEVELEAAIAAIDVDALPGGGGGGAGGPPVDPPPPPTPVAGVAEPLATALIPTNRGFVLDLGVLPHGIDPATGAEGVGEDFYGDLAYSGMDYTPVQKAVFRCGAGHAVLAQADGGYAFEFSTAKWRPMYLPTSTAILFADSNADGKPDCMPDYATRHVHRGAAYSTTEWVPLARHTYDGLRYLPAPIDRFVLLHSTGGAAKNVPVALVNAFQNGGGAAEFNFGNAQWSDAGVPTFNYNGANRPIPFGATVCPDPVSGAVLLIGGAGNPFILVYGPASRAIVTKINLPDLHGYADESCVYYPPTDSFLYFTRVAGVPVWEFKLNRTGAWGFAKAPTKLVTNARPERTGGPTVYRYNEKLQMITGGLSNGVYYGFKPAGDGVSGKWLSMPVTVPGQFYVKAGVSLPIPYDVQDFHQAAVPEYDVDILIVKPNAASTGITYGGYRTIAIRVDAAQMVDPVQPAAPASIMTPAGTASSMQAAVNGGGPVSLSAGALDDRGAAHVRAPITIRGVGPGLTKIVSTGIEGKGIFVIDSDTELDCVDLAGAAASDLNGAAIRWQGGHLRVKNSILRDSQNGILGGAIPGKTGYVVDSSVLGCGAGDGRSHGLYIGKCDRFTATNVQIDKTDVGHHLKSRAQATDVLSCTLGLGFSGTESYNLDLPNGGDGYVADTVMRQGTKTENSVMLNYGGEPPYWPVNSLKVARTRFVSTVGGTAVRNGIPGVVVDLNDCDFDGPQDFLTVLGPCRMTKCRANGVPLKDIP